MTDIPTLTFNIDKQPVEPVIIQFQRDVAIWTFRPQMDFSYRPRYIPGTPENLPSVALGVKCSCGKLNYEIKLDVIGFTKEDELFGGAILRGATMELGRTPHDHLVNLSNSLNESYDAFIEKKKSEAKAK